MFTITKEMPNGSITRYHKVIRVETHVDATHAVLNSYHKPEMEMISWQDTYTIPHTVKIETLHDAEIVLTAPGAPFDGGVIVPDDEGVDQARLKARVKLKRDQVEWGGFETPYGRFDSDPRSQAKLLMQAGRPGPFNWTLADNTSRELTAEQMAEVLEALANHVSLCQARKAELDAQIDDLAEMDIESGWPA